MSRLWSNCWGQLLGTREVEAAADEMGALQTSREHSRQTGNTPGKLGALYSLHPLLRQCVEDVPEDGRMSLRMGRGFSI